jgi:imidazolonepropionase-like amidohydrolase
MSRKLSEPSHLSERYVLVAPVVFDGSRFLDGGGEVFVENGLIVGIERRGHPVPDSWQRWELSGSILPGLVDSHVHLVAGSEPDALSLDAARTPAEREQVIRQSLKAQLAAGVTAVRDLGDTKGAVLARAQLPYEPTVVGAGPPITVPGGHCAAMGGAASGITQLRIAVAYRHELGAQIIKLVVSGGAMTTGSDLLRLQFSLPEVQSVVQEAHRLGLLVTAHAHSWASVDLCVEAGVDQIEHCTCLTEHGINADPELADRIAAAGIAVCPTFGRVPGSKPSPQALEVIRRTGMSLEQRFTHTGILHAAGVRLSAGTDAGIHAAKPHGVIAHAIPELLASDLSVETALAAATSTAADICGLGESSGRLRVGRSADLIVVNGDLSKDVGCLAQPHLVLLRGKVVAGQVPVVALD